MHFGIFLKKKNLCKCILIILTSKFAPEPKKKSHSNIHDAFTKAQCIKFTPSYRSISAEPGKYILVSL